METKNKIFRLSGKVQHYQWGGDEYIPQMLHIKNEQHQPFAEYWLGAHNNAPSLMEGGEPLNEYLARHPEALGEELQKEFGRLPYLLKILDVKDMLSIQVHPSRESARMGFAGENEMGIALEAPHRNYKDDNHKPELMMALGEFWLLHGFRGKDSLLQVLDSEPELRFLAAVFEKQGYRGAYELAMTLPQAKVNAILQPLLDRIVPAYQSGSLSKQDPGFWAARASITFNHGGNIDRGIFSVYMLNLVHLTRGEAIFQDAGILHAYLEGQNVEIMANSDNVLRGGLTPKHIDVPELMKHVAFAPVEPFVIPGTPANAGETIFPTPALDFELSRIVLGKGEIYQADIHSATIFFALNGEVTVAEEGQTININAGEAFVVLAGAVLKITGGDDAELYKAGAGRH